jgi:two-component system sensor histidine kinase CpxA
MSRLFLRIFLWFWLGSTVLVLVLVASVIMSQPDVITTWRFIGRTAMQYVGSHVADIYEKGGASAAAAVIRNIDREGRLQVWLYAADGRFVAGPGPVADAQDVIARSLASDDAERIVGRESSILARRAYSGSGAAYVVMWEAPRPLRGYAQMSPLRSATRLAALVLTSGIVCWLLTWQITRPIGTLRAGARRFADGDLSVRVGLSPELRRGDELADLAKEFDRMAGRIQELITSQQQLLADISHELRSPLARLSLALDLARRRLGSDVPEHERMGREIRRLDDLIGQLLTLARLRAQTAPPAFEPVRLLDVVREVAQDAGFEAKSSGRMVTIEREIDVTVPGNRALLRSALENVVRNGARYAPEGTAVSIAMEVDGGRAAIVVRDRGPGVPTQALTRLFDPFFRVDEARDRTSGGIGLGLAIARQAMVAHGGTASAQNHPDGGLIVRLELPMPA